MFKRLKNPFEKEAGFEMGESYADSYHTPATQQYQQAPEAPTTASETPPRVFEMHTTSPQPSQPYRTSMLELDDELDQQEEWEEETTNQQGKNPSFLDEETPETTIGKGVSIKGELSFQRLIRIDGSFEGTLNSEGKLIIGPTGTVISNLELSEAIIEGRVEGNLKVRGRLELRGEAQIQGDIAAKTLSVDEGVSILGEVRVTPFAEEEDPYVKG